MTVGGVDELTEELGGLSRWRERLMAVGGVDELAEELSGLSR